MNWPFSKPVVKQNIVPRMVQKDFEKEEKKIQQFEDINKKFYKDVKRYIESIDETNKSELKLINNLLNVINSSPPLTTTTTATTSSSTTTSTNSNSNTLKLTHSLSIPALTSTTSSFLAAAAPTTTFNHRSSSVDNFNNKIILWKQTHLNQNQNYLEKLKLTCQHDVIEPMKKLNLIFPNVYSAIKRREQAYNELIKQQIKLDKLQEKERTGPNLVKINQQQQNVNLAKNLFQKEHLLLMDELPKFYNSRIKYIYPCIQQLIKSQIEFYSNYSNNYEKLLDENNLNLIYNNSNSSTSTTSSITSSSRSISSILSNQIDQQQSQQQQQQIQQNETQIDDDIKKLLNEIKSLSIVASD